MPFRVSASFRVPVGSRLPVLFACFVLYAMPEFKAAIPLGLSLPGVVATCSAQEPSPLQARRYFSDHLPGILREFHSFLQIPNHSGDLPNIEKNAAWLEGALRRRGVETQRLQLDEVPPVVLGSLDVGADRMLAIYAHYDGQPVDASQWRQSPWEMTLYTGAIESGGVRRNLPVSGEPWNGEWRLYARSVSDDKAPIIALLTVLDAYRASGIPLRSNLLFFFEGEEEAGSPHLGAYMDRYAEQLEADMWLIFDGPSHQSHRPQLVFGVRGYTGLDISVYGANRYLHSGHYGNWAPNPAMRLAQLLASMKDDKGHVLVRGFYDSVVPAEASIKSAAKTIPPFEDQLRREFGLAASENDNAPYLEEMLLPSLNIRGLQSATVGTTARNIIPPIAIATLDLRLVKGNDPAEMLDLVEKHIRAQGYFIVREDPSPMERLQHNKIAKVVRREGYSAMRTSMKLANVQWLEERVRQVAGDRLVLMPTMGGSLPLYLFEEKLRKPLVIVPIVNFDNNQHAPNENLRLGNLAYGVEILASIFAGR